MITTECLPDTGQVLVPPHLRVVHVSSTPSFVKSMGLYANLVFGVHPSPDYLVYANMERVGKILKRLSLDQSWLYQATWKDSESAVPHFSLEEEEEPEHEDDHYLGHEQEEDFVDERGLELDPSTKHRRRKRTVFFSANDVFGEFKETADFTCSLGDESEIKFEARDKSKSQGWWGCAA
eukprot:g1195.t1